MTWRQIDRYHMRRDDGAKVCACKGPHGWRFRASKGRKWCGPWRETSAEAKADVEDQ